MTQVRIGSTAEHEQLSPLMLAALGDHASAALALLEGGADACAALCDGTSALMLASRCGAVGVVSALLEHSRAVRETIDHIITNVRGGSPNSEASVAKGFTPLFMACRFGHAEVVRLLVSASASLDKTTSLLYTPLQYACEFGQQEALACCIKLGADVNHRATKGWHALFDACMNGHDEIVQVLISAGADVNAQRSNGASGLTFASQNGHEAVVRALIAAGADVNVAVDKVTPLIKAVTGGHMDCVRILLESAPSSSIQHALGVACGKGMADAVELLLRHGASPSTPDESGCSPLDLCRTSSWLEPARRAHIEEILLRFD